MKNVRIPFGIVAAFVISACGSPDSDQNVADDVEDAAPTEASASVPLTEIAPGLSMRILREGDGEAAEAGQIAVVHYTGWLFDEEASSNRGEKFDSSLDRDLPFEFPLGANPRRVIEGWDTGVVGMRVGELRELVIAPEMGYGERGAGGVIPPGATLVFEIALSSLQTVQPDGIKLTKPELTEPGSSE